MTRRTIGRIVLVTLIAIHLAAFGLYVVRGRQSALLEVYLDGRDQWRDNHLDRAAADYQTFVEERPWVAWPLVLVRGFPDESSGWYVLGRVQAERHEVEAALSDLERAMQTGNGRGRREYRDLLLTSGQAARLVAFAEAARRHDPDSPLPYKDLGAARLATREPRAAVVAYEAALARLPAWRARTDPAAPAGLSGEEADLLNLLSVASLQAGDTARAEAVCTDIATRQGRYARLDRLCRAALLAAQGDIDTARTLLKSYQPPAPEHDAIVQALVPTS
jgi:tetratricopeptide (TPR) repeat protein